MAERMDFSSHDESVIDSNSVTISNNHISENGFNGIECGNLEERDEFRRGQKRSLSDEEHENMGHNGASASTSNLNQEELQYEHGETLQDIELEIAAEIAETAVETIRNKLEYIHEKCMVCADNLNEFFQHVYNESKHAYMLRNWNRAAELHDFLTKSEPYYRPLLMIMEVIEKISEIIDHHGDCLTKFMVNKVIRTCNALEDIAHEIMSSVPKI